MINIELKNSNVRYEGMEEKVLALVQQYGLEQSIIYSSFYPESMGLLRQLQPNVSTGILGSNIHQCFADMQRMHADAVHTWNGGMDMNPKEIRKFADIPVRVWNGEEPLYGQDRPLKEFHMTKYALLGATDIFTNIPEKYLSTGDV
jgi:glycerophosphoryl diester phosphodiesterase